MSAVIFAIFTVIFYCPYLSLCTIVYTIQHRTVVTIFPLILQIIIIAQLLPTTGREAPNQTAYFHRIINITKIN